MTPLRTGKLGSRGPEITLVDTTGAYGLAWTLHGPGVTAAIGGARRPEQIDGWIGAAHVRLDEPTLEEIATVGEETSAGSGPARPPQGARA
jgi:aryl-alcohol dehydrogenase-like predicted oxidoreductase